MVRKSKFVVAGILMIAMLACTAAAGYAAPFTLSVTAQKAFDKMTAEAPAGVGAALTKNYAELQKLQQQEIDWDHRISNLHYKNEENEASLRKRIKDIDNAKLSALEADIEKTEKQYEPLFELYDSQKSQLSLAKASKNKDLIAFANAQVTMTKIAVQAANKEIDAKEDKLKKAKSDASAKMKAVRDMLGGNDKTESQIKAAKSSASHTKKRFSAEADTFVKLVRKGDAKGSAKSLTSLLGYQKQILVQKINVHSLEGQIAAVIAKADAKLKGYGA